MTMKDMEKTMETMRSICGPKYKLTDETIEGSRSFREIFLFKVDKVTFNVYINDLIKIWLQWLSIS